MKDLALNGRRVFTALMCACIEIFRCTGLPYDWEFTLQPCSPRKYSEAPDRRIFLANVIVGPYSSG